MKAKIKPTEKTIQMNGLLSKKQITAITNEYTRNFVEQRLETGDLFMLMAIHDLLGFGKKRLRRFFIKCTDLMDEYRGKFGEAEDMNIAIKNDLKHLGFDYDEEVRQSIIRGRNVKSSVWINKEINK